MASNHSVLCLVQYHEQHRTQIVCVRRCQATSFTSSFPLGGEHYLPTQFGLVPQQSVEVQAGRLSGCCGGTIKAISRTLAAEVDEGLSLGGVKVGRNLVVDNLCADIATNQFGGVYILQVDQSILKEISPGCSLEGLMLKLKLQYFGHLMRKVDSLEKTLMLGGIRDRRRRG